MQYHVNGLLHARSVEGSRKSLRGKHVGHGEVTLFYAWMQEWD